MRQLIHSSCNGNKFILWKNFKDISRSPIKSIIMIRDRKEYDKWILLQELLYHVTIKTTFKEDPTNIIT